LVFCAAGLVLSEQGEGVVQLLFELVAFLGKGAVLLAEGLDGGLELSPGLLVDLVGFFATGTLSCHDMQQIPDFRLIFLA